MCILWFYPHVVRINYKWLSPPHYIINIMRIRWLYHSQIVLKDISHTSLSSIIVRVYVVFILLMKIIPRFSQVYYISTINYIYYKSSLYYITNINYINYKSSLYYFNYINYKSSLCYINYIYYKSSLYNITYINYINW